MYFEKSSYFFKIIAVLFLGSAFSVLDISGLFWIGFLTSLVFLFFMSNGMKLLEGAGIGLAFSFSFISFNAFFNYLLFSFNSGIEFSYFHLLISYLFCIKIGIFLAVFSQIKTNEWSIIKGFVSAFFISELFWSVVVHVFNIQSLAGKDGILSWLVLSGVVRFQLYFFSTIIYTFINNVVQTQEATVENLPIAVIVILLPMTPFYRAFLEPLIRDYNLQISLLFLCVTLYLTKVGSLAHLCMSVRLLRKLVSFLVKIGWVSQINESSNCNDVNSLEIEIV